MLQYFFAKGGTVTPYKIFSAEHFVMLSICALCICVGLWHNRNADHKKVLNLTRVWAILLWVLEIAKITFNIAIGNGSNPNTYIPLYFCSIPLYCSIMSGWGKGKIKNNGDVFMIVGGFAGGVAYLCFPSTTAGFYQAFHFITFQSYILHAGMVFLSFLYMITGYHKLRKSNFKYYATTITVMCLIAYVFNYFFESNLMFVSRNFPGSPVELVYNLSPTLFPILMKLIQILLPFAVVYGVTKLFTKQSK